MSDNIKIIASIMTMISSLIILCAINLHFNPKIFENNGYAITIIAIHIAISIIKAHFQLWLSIINFLIITFKKPC